MRAVLIAAAILFIFYLMAVQFMEWLLFEIQKEVVLDMAEQFKNGE